MKLTCGMGIVRPNPLVEYSDKKVDEKRSANTWRVINAPAVLNTFQPSVLAQWSCAVLCDETVAPVAAIAAVIVAVPVAAVVVEVAVVIALVAS